MSIGRIRGGGGRSRGLFWGSRLVGLIYNHELWLVGGILFVEGDGLTGVILNAHAEICYSMLIFDAKCFFCVDGHGAMRIEVITRSCGHPETIICRRSP